MPTFYRRYAPLGSFVAPAQGRTEIWRTLAGLAIACVFYFVAIQVILYGVMAILGPVRGAVALTELTQGSSPVGLIELLFSYLPLTGGLAMGLAILMNRGLGTLIGPLRPAVLTFLWVAVPLMALSLLLLPLSVISVDVGRHLTLAKQLPWVPLALIGLLIQTGTEELLFRGYLQQQLGARYASVWVWMGLPAVAFGLLHYSPDEYGASAVFVVIWAVCFGLAAADLTARTGNLGAAIGLHFANNAASLLLVGVYGQMDGLALYNTVLNMNDPWALMPYLAIDSITLLVNWLAARLILRV
ncbi:MAG: type II CAAX endopeptidase family protein [Paracoccaceae bacterium]